MSGHGIMRRLAAFVQPFSDKGESSTTPRLERLFSIAAAALVLAFWGATLTWPAMLLVAAILFQDSLRSMFDGIKAFLSRTAELEVSLGLNRSFKFSGPKASDFLQKMADEVKAALARLTDDQAELFLYLTQNSQVRRQTLGEGPLKFSRVRPRTVLHWDLRDLRDIGLARPDETGSWREAVHPAITPFGELAHTLFFEGRQYDTRYIEQYLSERAHQPSLRQREA
jgi:hypothetical protein